MAEKKNKTAPRRASKSARKHVRRLKQEARQNVNPAVRPIPAAK